MRSTASARKNSGNPQRADLFDELLRIIRAGRRILVASHIDPDGDALGSQLAVAEYLRSLGKEVLLARDSEIPAKYRFLPGVDAIIPSDNCEGDVTVDTAIILECPVPERVGRVHHCLNSDVKIVNIDHHFENDGFGDLNWVDSSMSSVGEMVYEFFESVGFAITPSIAVNLYTAILTDTGRFRFESTSPRTMEIAGLLIAAGANPREICDHVYFSLPASTLQLTGKVLNTVEFHFDDRLCTLELTRDMVTQAGAVSSESDGIVDYTMYNERVKIGILFKEAGDATTKVSLRSNNGSRGVNVSQLAGRFGGGGHVNAAGCTVEKPLAEVKAEFLSLVKEVLDVR